MDSRHVGVPNRDGHTLGILRRHALHADEIRAELLAIGSDCEYQTGAVYLDVTAPDGQVTQYLLISSDGHYMPTGNQRFICSCGFDIDWAPTDLVAGTSLAHLRAEHPAWDW